MKLSENVLLRWDSDTKRSHFTPQSVNAPDVVQKRNEWVHMISEADADKLVFLDESGVNTNMTRHYGRAVGKERAVDNAPKNTPTRACSHKSLQIGIKAV